MSLVCSWSDIVMPSRSGHVVRWALNYQLLHCIVLYCFVLYCIVPPVAAIMPFLAAAVWSPWTHCSSWLCPSRLPRWSRVTTVTWPLVCKQRPTTISWCHRDDHQRLSAATWTRQRAAIVQRSSWDSCLRPAPHSATHQRSSRHRHGQLTQRPIARQQVRSATRPYRVKLSTLLRSRWVVARLGVMPDCHCCDTARLSMYREGTSALYSQENQVLEY